MNEYFSDCGTWWIIEHDSGETLPVELIHLPTRNAGGDGSYAGQIMFRNAQSAQFFAENIAPRAPFPS
jgi:hypothetical protein